MPCIARREGLHVRASFVGGDLSIIHEADNGILVVRLPRRKHWKDGEPDIPVRYSLARLYTGEDAVKARSRTLCNSAHYADMPDVIEMIGRDVEASTRWRAVRAEMVAKAEAHAA